MKTYRIFKMINNYLTFIIRKIRIDIILDQDADDIITSKLTGIT